MVTEEKTLIEELSLISLFVAILRHGRLLVIYTVVGVAFGTVLALTRPIEYRSTASFITSQAGNQSRNGLSSLAGQFGISIPESNGVYTTEFYLRLLKSRTILERVGEKPFVVRELDNQKRTLLELLDIKTSSLEEAAEISYKELNDMVNAEVSKLAGTIELSATTKWPSVSKAIVERALKALGDVNIETQQQRAKLERLFLEDRIDATSQSLQDAENSMLKFLQANRDYMNSPELTFQHNKLQRDLMFQQQVFGSLAQKHEEVSLSEVRNIPQITVVEAANIALTPQPRGRLMRVFLGLLAGAMFGVTFITLKELTEKARINKNPGIEDLDNYLRNLGNDIKERFRKEIRK